VRKYLFESSRLLTHMFILVLVNVFSSWYTIIHSDQLMVHYASNIKLLKELNHEGVHLNTIACIKTSKEELKNTFISSIQQYLCI